MRLNRVQFQAGLSMFEFHECYGTTEPTRSARRRWLRRAGLTASSARAARTTWRTAFAAPSAVCIRRTHLERPVDEGLDGVHQTSAYPPFSGGCALLFFLREQPTEAIANLIQEGLRLNFAFRRLDSLACLTEHESHGAGAHEHGPAGVDPGNRPELDQVAPDDVEDQQVEEHNLDAV